MQYIWSVVTPKGVPIQEEYLHFSDLKNMAKKLMHKALVAAPWISEATCRLYYQNKALR